MQYNRWKSNSKLPRKWKMEKYLGNECHSPQTQLLGWARRGWAGLGWVVARW